MSKIDWQAVRAEFPALENWTYLNTATYGQIPRRSVEAACGHWTHRDGLACTDFLSWYAEADRLREPVARLIHAAPQDIAFLGTTSSSLGAVINGLPWRADDTIVTLADEFPNQLYLPNVREVPWERFYESIDQHTRMVAISEVNYSTGFRPPLAEVSRFCRERGVILYVDGAQSVGALQFDVRATQVDVLAVHAYKWMCSPTASGFTYFSPDMRHKLRPTMIGWRSHRTWRNVDNLHHGAPEFVDSAEKYEGGGLPFSLLNALGATVEWMLELGPAAIEQRVLELAAATRARLQALGAETHESGSQIVCVRFAGRDPSQLARELKSRRIAVAARHGYLRVSPHFYNNEADLDCLEQELRRLL
jgi:cysteine desulfurase/selenocysteine lyase